MKTVKHSDVIRKHGADILDSKGMQVEKDCVQHGVYSVYDHSLFVTSMCISLSKKLRLKVDERSLVRGALLHDYFLYDWHEKSRENMIHGFTHPGKALKNAEKYFKLNDIEKNMIKRHMFPLTPVPPKFKESMVLCVADKICATYETLGGFKRRIGKRIRRVGLND